MIDIYSADCFPPAIADVAQRPWHSRITMDTKYRITGHTKVFLTWLTYFEVDISLIYRSYTVIANTFGLSRWRRVMPVPTLFHRRYTAG